MKHYLSVFLLVLFAPLHVLAQTTLGTDTSTFGRTIHLHAMGDPAANGAALLATRENPIITSRTDPEKQPVVIELGAGLFDLEANVFMMPDHVRLRGAGKDSTIISCLNCPSVLLSEGTNNQFSQFTVESLSSITISGTSGANVQVHDVKATGPVGVVFRDAETVVRITDSILLSNFDDALALASGAKVTVERSVIDGPDEKADGIICGGGADCGPGNLTVRHTYIGTAGVTNSWDGTLVCAYISDATGEVSGCPQAPGPADP